MLICPLSNNININTNKTTTIVGSNLQANANNANNAVNSDNANNAVNSNNTNNTNNTVNTANDQLAHFVNVYLLNKANVSLEFGLKVLELCLLLG
jgi:uncharacterized protein YpmS